jgi:hypothetical protein
MDGTTGRVKVSVNADTSNPPTTQRAWGKSYNNSTYYGFVQLTVPIRKGEYYRILCDGAASCTAPKFIGDLLAYFIPLGQ